MGNSPYAGAHLYSRGRAARHTDITLNTATRIEIIFTRHIRQVHLLSGEIFPNVQHDPNRPFVVMSDGVRITALGTPFDVYKRAHSLTVSDIEGASSWSARARELRSWIEEIKQNSS
jgi:transmembrane sensor